MASQKLAKDIETFGSTFDTWSDYFFKIHDNDKGKLCAVVRDFDSIQLGASKSISEGLANLKTLKLKFNNLKREFKGYPIQNDDYHKYKDIIKSYEQKFDYTFKEIDKLKEVLPKYPSYPIKLLLGNMDVTLYRNKLGFKESYEKHKIYASLLGILLMVLNLLFFNQKLADSIVHCYSLYYYMSLAIQESVLVANGSRIKLWWRMHHYLASISIIIMLVWPDGPQYYEFRFTQFLFGITQCCSQIFQFTYQQKQLYRLRSMGAEAPMTTTNSGHEGNFVLGSRCLLIPFLGMIYMFQLCISYKLFLMFKESGCYQVLIQSILFFIFGIINSFTLIQVIYAKSLASKKQLISCDSSENMRSK